LEFLLLKRCKLQYALADGAADCIQGSFVHLMTRKMRQPEIKGCFARFVGPFAGPLLVRKGGAFKDRPSLA